MKGKDRVHSRKYKSEPNSYCFICTNMYVSTAVVESTQTSRLNSYTIPYKQ